MNPRIVVTRRLPTLVEERLRSRYAAVSLNSADMRFSTKELRQSLVEADIVLCTLGDRLTRELLTTSNRRTVMLANFGAGVDHLDRDAARDAGIIVTNTPGALTEDTADLTMLLILAAARRASEGERELRGGAWTGWRPTHLLGCSVHGATLGIVGFGRIGRAVAHRAHFGFGMRVSYVSRSGATPLTRDIDYAAREESLESLLRVADFVSLHCPYTSDTHHLISEKALRAMKRTSFLINTSRGEVVDTSALVAALRSGAIAGAGLDVHEGEPELDATLLAAPNATLLPHIGSATIASRTAMGMMCADSIDAFVAGRDVPNRIV